jgi:hypothetical protein
MARIQFLKRYLYQYFTVTMEVSFKQFRLGLSLFFCGLVAIYGAGQLLTPSLQQELVVLVGLMIGGAGFVIALLGQIRMMVSRFWHFFQRPKN